MNVITKNIMEHAGGTLFTNPSIVFKNISVLNKYNVKLTNDDNNNSYTLLGMHHLEEKLDYLIEKKQWEKGKEIDLDTIDLLRGLIIKDDYSKYLVCKKNGKYGRINVASSISDEFDNKLLDEERIKSIFDDHNSIKNIFEKLDSEFLISDGIYSIDGNVVSRQRVLRNICNYRGNGTDEEIIKSAFTYKSNVTDINAVFKVVLPLLEMGEKGVKLS